MPDAVRRVVNGAVNGAIYSPDGATIYTVRSSTGTVTAYSTADGAELASYAIGNEIGGYDVTPDGTHLVAVERTPGPLDTHGSSLWWNYTTPIKVYSIDLTTGVTQTFTTMATGLDSSFWDVASISNTKVVLTQDFNGSGWLPLTTLDISTGTFTRSSTSDAQDGTLTASADHSLVLFAPSNISDAPLRIVDGTGGIVASHGNYADNVSGYNGGVQAITSSGNRVAQNLGSVFLIYDTALHLQTRFSTINELTGGYGTQASGMVFNSTGTELYVLDSVNNLIYDLAVSDGHLIKAFLAGMPVPNGGLSLTSRPYGSALQLSPDGQHLSAADATGLRIVDIGAPPVITGSAGVDVISGTAGDDVIYGFNGNDTLSGGAGNDLLVGGVGSDMLDGGTGNDTALINAYRVATTISLLANGDLYLIGSDGGDTLRSIEKIQFIDRIVNVNDLVITGTPGNDDLTGTADTAVILGLGGDDILRIGASSGATLTGGDGDDIYYITKDGRADATISENATGGTDTIHLAIANAGYPLSSYAMPNNVEKLILDSVYAASVTGNAGANRITGNAGDDMLQGLAGDDVLEGKGGNDFLNGGDGNDIAVIAAPFAASSVALTASGTIVVTSADGTDTLLYVETIRFNDQDVATSNYGVLGSSQNDVLLGTSGRDLMFGYDGDDMLNGGAGADVMDGGAGNDTYFVDNENDVVIERQYAQYDVDTIITSVSYNAPANVEVIKLVEGANGPISATGNAQLIGNSLANILIGSAGNDILDGGLGDDILDGSSGTSDVTLFHANMAQSVLGISGADISVTGPDGKDTVRNIEILRFNDGNIATAQIAPVVANYETWGGRDPNGFEASYWTGFLQRGGTLAQMKNAILDDPLGQANTRVRVTDLYQTYGGRAPTAGEISAWNTNLHNGATFDTVRLAIANDQLGRTHTAAVTTDLYSTYGGRAPTAGEVSAWQNNVASGATYDDERRAILNDPLGRGHTAAVTTDLYQTYGGRAPTAGEISAWQTNVANGATYGNVRTAILNDPLGRTHTADVTTDLYQTYGGRAPTAGEISAWQYNVAAGATYGDVRTALLNDTLGRTHTSDVTTDLYQTYGGRAPTAGEISAWQYNVAAGATYGDVRTAILNDPLGQTHSDATITALYSRYFGRAAAPFEIQAWKDNVRAGATFDAVRDTLLSDGGSAATGVQQVRGTSAADAFELAAGFHDVVFTAFDPTADTISLRNTPFAGIDPLGGGRARQITAINGDQDVLITFDDQHSLLLHHVQLSQLSAADFLI